MRTTTREKVYEVVIVSANRETLDGLQAYLDAAGVRAKSMRDIESCASSTSASVLAVVLFPDDYRWEAVLAELASLTERRPMIVPVIVTSQPKRFDALVDRERVVVVARPAWGWTITDAIRTHVRHADEAR